jgi:hypothetical protein
VEATVSTRGWNVRIPTVSLSVLRTSGMTQHMERRASHEATTVKKLLLPWLFPFLLPVPGCGDDGGEGGGFGGA